MDEFSLSQRMTAEFLGTLWLVLGGCGGAVLAFRLVHTKPQSTIVRRLADV